MKRLLAGLVASQVVWLGAAAMAACPTLADLKPSGVPSGQGAATYMAPTRQAPSKPMKPPQGPLESAVITLERGQCLGACSAYKVELHGDGQVVYTGTSDVVVTGEHKGVIAPGDFACLVELFREAGFWSLRESYVASITDGPPYELTITIDGKTRRLVDYLGRAVGMPSSVVLIEDQIDRLVTQPFRSGDDRTLNWLTAEGFDFHSTEAGRILARAAAAGKEDIALGLLARGAPVDGRLANWNYVRGDRGPTALVAAAGGGRGAVVKALLAAGASTQDRDQALIAGAEAEAPACVEALLAAGANPNVIAYDGMSVLMVAADRSGPERADQLTVLRLLLDAGADVRARDDEGGTVLHHAWGLSVIKLLVEAGADLEARDKEGRTPLLAAYGDDAVLAFLAAGADPRAVANNGDTPAKMAWGRDWKRAADALVALGVPRYIPPPKKR